MFVVTIDFETILPGISVARNQATHAGDQGVREEPEEGQFHGIGTHLGQDLLGKWTLQGKLGGVWGEIDDFDTGILGCGLGIVPGDPCQILFGVRGVHHHPILVGTEAVDNQIIDNRSVGIAHERIDELAIFHIGDRIGNQVIEVFAGTRSGDHAFAHVGYVEQARLLPDRMVFRNDSRGKVDRQLPSPEIDHPDALIGCILIM
jgi:hypothetical protein